MVLAREGESGMGGAQPAAPVLDRAAKKRAKRKLFRAKQRAGVLPLSCGVMDRSLLCCIVRN